MRTLLVSGIYRPEIGGPATYVPSLAEQLIKQGCKVDVITLKNSQADEIVEPWAVKFITRDQFLGLRFIKTVFSILLKSLSSNYVFANGLYQETALSLLVLRKKSVAKIVGDPVWERATNRGDTSLGISEFNRSDLRIKHKIQRNFLRWSLNRFTSITCPSKELEGLVKDWGVTKPITCIPNGIAPVMEQVNTQEFDLITVCRLVKWKNLDKLIITNARNKTSLVIVGSGPEEETLRKLAKDMNSNVTFTGLLNEELVLNYLFKSKVFVLISSYEGLSFSLLQAMACGLPSIVSEIQGNMDVVTHEQEGIVVDASQDDSLIAAINLLLNDPIKRSTLGKNSLVKVNSKFSQTVQINKVISQLVNGVNP